MLITCPFCATTLDVGDETRAVVAICISPTQIRVCDQKFWGSPKTRVECASDADYRDQRTNETVVAHVLQTDPPETDEERREREATQIALVAGEPSRLDLSVTDP